ncbi:MAG: UDP-3-O-acyl-N-acetylglucosamine deacetylase [Thermoguttaceae bacterium]|nr:UDP-3-O-acyl-N-acetylglucosamine deacetylase [Thermoguttaceae bacterium]
MHATRPQRTIARPAVVTGFGFWSGRDVRLEFRPAPADSGIVFVRSDLEGCPRIPADVAHRVETPRRTSLRSGRAGVEMVEHVLASLVGLAIDNCEIWTDQPEMPGCDGSAWPFVEALDRAGLVEQDAPPTRRIVRETIRLGDDEAWIEARPAASPGAVFRYKLDYGPNSPIGRQVHHLALSPETFRRELAPCRTFMLKQEADWLLAQGIGTRATAKDLLVYGDDGPIDNQPRFDNECARHKLLDMIGDLALAQCELVGQFHAFRSGHRLNGELVRVLLRETEIVRTRKRCA